MLVAVPDLSMFQYVICKITGHTDKTEVEYQWDIPLRPASVPDECMRDGFVSCKWHYCPRCGDFIKSESVPTDEAPSPTETAPLI